MNEPTTPARTSTPSSPYTTSSSTSTPVTPQTPTTGTTMLSDSDDRRAVEKLLPARVSPKTPTRVGRRRSETASGGASVTTVDRSVGSVIDLTDSPSSSGRASSAVPYSSRPLLDRLASVFDLTGPGRAASVRPLPRTIAVNGCTASAAGRSVEVKTEETNAIALAGPVWIEVKDEESVPSIAPRASVAPVAAVVTDSTAVAGAAPTVAPAMAVTAPPAPTTPRRSTPAPTRIRQRSTAPSTRQRSTTPLLPTSSISHRTPTPSPASLSPLAASRRARSITSYSRPAERFTRLLASRHPGWTAGGNGGSGVDVHRRDRDSTVTVTEAVAARSTVAASQASVARSRVESKAEPRARTTAALQSEPTEVSDDDDVVVTSSHVTQQSHRPRSADHSITHPPTSLTRARTYKIEFSIEFQPDVPLNLSYSYTSLRFPSSDRVNRLKHKLLRDVQNCFPAVPEARAGGHLGHQLGQ